MSQTRLTDIRHALQAIAIACFVALALCAVFDMPLAHAEETEQTEAAEALPEEAEAAEIFAEASAEAFEYDGDDEKFLAADGSRFGMYEKQEGSTIAYWDGEIIVNHIPNNKTIYAGFYLNACIDDPGTWDEVLFMPATDDGLLNFSLDESYAGMAWPIAPVQRKDPNKTTAGQYYLYVPPLEKIPGYLNTVIFTDGIPDGNGQCAELGRSEVQWGEDAEPPEVPEREGFTFDGWDDSYTEVTEDMTINATWMQDNTTYYKVTFLDGWGATLKTEKVAEGKAATAPSDPKHDGYTFTGWDPADFDEVTQEMTVTACWIDNNQLALETAKRVIAALPSDLNSIMRDTGNQEVASAADAYLALSDELKAQLSEDERLLVAKCAIIVLPSDSYQVTSELEDAIGAAQSVYDSLPEGLQTQLDTETVGSGTSRSFGRYLENAAWALDSLREVDNGTTLKAGTYTDQVQSSSNLGKTSSRRNLTFTVKSVTVKDGKATAIVEHSSNTSQTLHLGGVEYQNLETDTNKKSYYEIPVNLNSTFHFSVKGRDAQDETDAISYEMTVSADESSMTPDSKADNGTDNGNGSDDDGKSNSSKSGDNKGSGSNSGSSSPSNANTADSGSSSPRSDKTDSSDSSDWDDDSADKNEGDDESGSDSNDSSDSGSDGDSSSGNDSSSSTGSTGSTGSGSTLTASGPNGSSSTTASGTRTGTSTSGTSGNLSSLLRTSSSTSGSTSSKTAASSSSASKKASGAESKVTSSAKAPAAGGNPQISEIGVGDAARGAAAEEDLRPAIAGGMMLLVSCGALGFALSFIRRESAAS